MHTNTRKVRVFYMKCFFRPNRRSGQKEISSRPARGRLTEDQPQWREEWPSWMQQPKFESSSPIQHSQTQFSIMYFKKWKITIKYHQSAVKWHPLSFVRVFRSPLFFRRFFIFISSAYAAKLPRKKAPHFAHLLKNHTT